MEARKNDLPRVARKYKRIRSVRSVYGTILSLVGLVMMLVRTGDLEVVLWWSLVILGGIYIYPSTIKEWGRIVSDILKFRVLKGGEYDRKD